MSDDTQINPRSERRSENSVLLREFFELKGKVEVMIERYDTVKEETEEHKRILKGSNGDLGHKTILANLMQEIALHRKMIVLIGAGVLLLLLNAPETLYDIIMGSL